MDLTAAALTGGWGSNVRLAAETVCDTKECRFQFFAAGYIAAGEDIIYNYGDFAISFGWEEFGL